VLNLKGKTVAQLQTVLKMYSETADLKYIRNIYLGGLKQEIRSEDPANGLPDCLGCD
jgi:hypothetical protein